MSTRHMRLAGHARVFALTDDAHTELLDYLRRARLTLGTEPETEETLRDLEASIEDQLEPLYTSADTVVTADEMLTILEQLGPIEADPTGLAASPTRRGPAWARVIEGKWLGGVCLGIATRGGFNPAWVRGLSVALVVLIAGIIAPLGEGIPMLVFLIAAVLAYLALMLLLPPVRTVREYQRMNGDAARHRPRRANWQSGKSPAWKSAHRRMGAVSIDPSPGSIGLTV